MNDHGEIDDWIPVALLMFMIVFTSWGGYWLGHKNGLAKGINKEATIWEEQLPEQMSKLCEECREIGR